ncbi:hypothetical protein M8C21_001698, partial [Ambrosia artemisiifolia]
DKFAEAMRIDDKMAGSIGVMLRELNFEYVESLPNDFDPTAVINDPVPPVAASKVNGEVMVNGKEQPREIVLWRNVHTIYGQTEHRLLQHR